MEAEFVPIFFHPRNPNLLNYRIESTLSKYSGKLSLCFEKEGRDVYLDFIEVFEEFRNSGIGTTILSKLIDFSKRFGSERIYFLVDFDNEKAQKLYKELGFKMTGKITNDFCYEMEMLL